MARTSNLVLLMDLVAKTPISPITNIESVYYEQKVDKQDLRISIASNLPVSYIDLNSGESDWFRCKSEVDPDGVYPEPPDIINFTDEDILGNINIADYIKNEIAMDYDSNYSVDVKICKETEEISANPFKISYLEQLSITGAESLTKIVESTYNLAQIFTSTFNNNNKIIHNSLYKLVDYVNGNLINVYNAIQKERQITHKYYDSVSDIFNGNYRESDLSWGYDLATGHSINDNVAIITDPYNPSQQYTLNLNGHANNELDPIAGVLDSTTITNIFNGFGLDFILGDFVFDGLNVLNLENKIKIFKLLNTEYVPGISTSFAAFNVSLTSRVAQSKIYKIILKVSGLPNDGAIVEIVKTSGSGIGINTSILGSDVVIKNGWNTIPVNCYEFTSSEKLSFMFKSINGITTNVNLHVLHIFGEQILTNDVDKNIVNVNKLYNKYTNSNNFVNLPGSLQIDSFGIIDDNMNCLTIGKDSSKHVVLTTNGHLKAFNNETYSELYLNAPYVLTGGEDDSLNTGGNITMSGSNKTVTNNGTLLNKEKIICNSASESNKLFIKNGFYLSSYANEDTWIDYETNNDIIPTSQISRNHITGFRNNQTAGSAEIASELNSEGNVILGLRVAGGAGTNQIIQLNVGNTNLNNNRNPQYASASIEINANNQNVVLKPKVVIDSLGNNNAELLVKGQDNSHNVTISGGHINAYVTEVTNAVANTVYVDELDCRNNNREIIINGSLTMDNQNYQLKCSKITSNNNENTVYVDGNLKATVNYVPGVYVGVPIGTIVMWTSGVVPDGWVLCNGTIYSINGEMSNLYAVIGTRYGGNATNNTFAVPDFRGMFPVGAGQAPNTYLNDDNKNTGYNFTLGLNDPNVGEYKHRLTGYELPSHIHDRGTLNAIGSLNYVYPSNYAGTSGAFKVSSTWSTNIKGGGASDNWGKSATFSLNQSLTGFVGPAGGGEAHRNVPPFVGINFIIKYK